MNWFARRSVVIVAGVVIFLPITVHSQTANASIAIRGSVSESLFLSMSPNAIWDGIRSNTVAEGGSLRVILSGTGGDTMIIRVPFLVRSNIGYKISALVESQLALVTELSVSDVRGTGKFVAPEAIRMRVVQQHDQMSLKDGLVRVANSSPPGRSTSSLLLSGPRVSLAGTLNSPDNALEISLLIKVTPEHQPGSWQLNVTFSGVAESIP